MNYQKRLLIDDDDDQEIFLTALRFVNTTHFCSTSNNPKDTLLFLKAGRLMPDIIFVDMNMPVMNGHQFIKEMKSTDHLKRIPVYILSTSINPETIKELINLGADRFITKPDNLDELIEILKSILSSTTVSYTSFAHSPF